jgi:hypothetical protein
MKRFITLLFLLPQIPTVQMLWVTIGGQPNRCSLETSWENLPGNAVFVTSPAFLTFDYQEGFLEGTYTGIGTETGINF